MALQKWAAPAGSPLLETLSDTGPGSGTCVVQRTFASEGDLSAGTQLTVNASGTITTTGSPTLTVNVAPFGGPGDGYTTTAATATDVTGQPWEIRCSATFRAASGAQNVAYVVEIKGLFSSEIVAVGTYTSTAGAGFGQASWAIRLLWDSVAADADSGDIITMSQADALWIG